MIDTSLSRSVNFRFFAKRRAQINERNARVAKLRAAMHTFDDQFNFVDRLGVVPHADEVRTFESLIGNALRKRMLIVQHDFERRDAIVFQPRFLFIVLVISRLDQDAVEWKRTFNVERYALADSISFDSLGPGRWNLSGWIALYVNDDVIMFALG